MRRSPLAALAAAIVYGASCLLDAPDAVPWGMGVEYAAMSEDPLGRVGDHPYRVLGPLLAWLLGLGGDRYWLFSHGCVVLVLSLVFVVALRDTRSPLRAFAVTSLWCATLANQLFKGSVGYAEPLTFALMLVSLLCAGRTWWFWLIQLLALLNHEAIVFVWPWLLLEKRERAQVGAPDLVGAVVALGLYGAARWWFTHDSGASLQSVEWYWNSQTISLETIGMWALIVPYTLVAFGAQAAVVGWQWGEEGFRRGVLPSLVMLGAICAMLLLAVDLQRFICFLAFPITVGAIRIANTRHGPWVLLALAAATHFTIVVQTPYVLTILRTMHAVGADSVARFFPDVILRIWPIYLGYVLALAALVAVGAWFGRRAHRAAASGRPT